MSWKQTICILTGVVVTAGIEVFALSQGMNGKLMALSLFGIGFLVALPIAPERVLGMFSKIFNRIAMKVLIACLSVSFLAGCAGAQFNPKAALDCVSCLLECTEIIVADADTGETYKLEGKELVRVKECGAEVEE